VGPTATPEPATGIGSTWTADAQRYDQWFDQPWGIANRTQFAQPPWNTATFLARADLHRLGAPHGQVTVTPALYAPTALPFIATWAPALEHLGRRIAQDWGAFNVLTITRSATP